MTGAQIVGWGHTKFGRLEDMSIRDLIVEAGREAINHSGVDPADIDAIKIGNFNNGLVDDGFISSIALEIDPALRFKPSTRLENACASGSAAIYAACDAIDAGRAKVVLVIGAEKMTAKSTEDVTNALAGAADQNEEAGVSFPEVFAAFANAYNSANGDHSRVLATIAAKNHLNAMNNPLAHLHKQLSVDFCDTIGEKNPIIATPLRMSDCSLISDGAAAIVLVDGKIAHDFENVVGFRAQVQVNDYLPMSKRDLLAFEGPAKAFCDAFEQARVSVNDLDFAEVHDCFTIAELLVYEAMGLAAEGRGRQVIEDGTVMADGKLPINLSGGLKAKGHPVGATGVSMHVLAAKQLTNQAGAMQKKGARLGCVFNMGGSAVANYCSILEPLRSAS